MHKLIRVIAEGENEEEAKGNAERILDDFIEWKYFDYYGTEEERIKSWDLNQDKIPFKIAYRINSPEGKFLLEQGIKIQEKRFYEAMKKIREAVSKFSDEELFNEEKSRDVKEKMIRQLEQDTGEEYPFFEFNFSCNELKRDSSMFVFVESSAIFNFSELNRWIETDSENNKLWVVLADVHI